MVIASLHPSVFHLANIIFLSSYRPHFFTAVRIYFTMKEGQKGFMLMANPSFYVFGLKQFFFLITKSS